MKHLFTILFLSFPLLINAQGSWERIDSPTSHYLRTLHFLDSLSGWIGGDSCFIFKTTDGGESWAQQYENFDFNIHDFHFLDENYGWAVASPEDGLLGTNSLMLNTTNGGDTWIETSFPTQDLFLYTVFYQDTLKGWMGGKNGNIFYTTDGGERWHSAFIDTGLFAYSDIMDLQFYNDTLAVASGGHIDASGVLWVSHDAGLNWQPNLVFIEPIVQFHFVDGDNIVGVARDIDGAYGSGTIRSTDGGETWVYTNFEYFGPGTSIAFRTPEEVWVTLSISQIMLFSADSGYTWQVIPSPENASVYKLQFTDSLHGIGVGEYGAIIKYVPDSVVNVSDNSFSRFNYDLYQNYPNPFNPATRIFYELAEPGVVSLIVYDAIGNEVAVLVNEYKSAGAHSTEFKISDSKNLSSGVYFCRMNAGYYSAVRKMIFLK